MTMEQAQGLTPYQKQGYVMPCVYAANEQCAIEAFAQEWLYQLLQVDDRTTYPLTTYHLWGQSLNIAHSDRFKAVNRHCSPPKPLADTILNPAMRTCLDGLLPEGWSLWDEGIGWLAFRFIRPGFGDGYPLSCKNWGPAKHVVSIWIPIAGADAHTTIGLLPESHLTDHPHFLPQNSKFTKDEYRYQGEVDPQLIVRPALQPGAVIVWHPKLLHTEAVDEGETTRLSLEFRVLPNVLNIEH